MTDLPWIPMALVAGAFLASLAVGEIVHRVLGIGSELTRKLDHATAGVIALALPFVFDSPWPVLVLAAPFIVLLVLTRLGGWLGSVHGIGRTSAGAYLFPIAIATTFVLARHDVGWYAIAILSLAFADAAGGLAGSRWGRRTFTSWGQPKTLEGSAAVFGVTSIIALVVLSLAGHGPIGTITGTLLTGLVVAFVEGALPWGLDNLGVPLAALAVLAALGSVGPLVVVVGFAAVGLGLALAVPTAPTARRERSPVAGAASPDGR